MTNAISLTSGRLKIIGIAADHGGYELKEYLVGMLREQPSSVELEHDFLWRTTRHLPERGRIGIFNRSYYEEVLIVRVHPEILETQRLPHELPDAKTIWLDRYRSIVDLDEHLHRNGTRIIKFFLHLSKDEQRERFLDRIDEPEKNLKWPIPRPLQSVALN